MVYKPTFASLGPILQEHDQEGGGQLSTVGISGKHSSGKHRKSYWSHGPVEIVALPINSMVDLSIVMLVYQRVHDDDDDDDDNGGW